MSRNKLLVISDSYTTAIRLIPVYNAACQDADFDPVFFSTNLNMPGLADLLNQSGVTPLDGNVIMRSQDHQQVAEWRNEYSRQFTTAAQKYMHGELSYRGIPVPPELFNLTEKMNHSKLQFLKLFDRLVEEVNPDMVLVAYCSGGSKRHYVTRARQLGLKTVHVQYSFYPEYKMFDRKRLNSEYVCLWGEAHRHTFLDETIDPAKAFVTGNPTFDPHRYNKHKVRRELNLADDEDVYLVGISCEWEELERMLSCLRYIKDLENKFFIIKLHPDLYNQVDRAKQVLNHHSIRHMVVGIEYTAYKLLAAADVLISFDADGLWLESLYFEVDSLLVSPPLMPQPQLPFKAMEGAVMVTKDPADLSRLDEMRESIDPAQKEEARRLLFYKRDFSAAPRVVQTLREIL